MKEFFDTLSIAVQNLVIAMSNTGGTAWLLVGLSMGLSVSVIALSAHYITRRG